MCVRTLGSIPWHVCHGPVGMDAPYHVWHTRPGGGGVARHGIDMCIDMGHRHTTSGPKLTLFGSKIEFLCGMPKFFLQNHFFRSELSNDM